MTSTLNKIAAAVSNGREYQAKAEVVPMVAARYPMLAKYLRDARDAYLTGATLAGLPTGHELPEIKELGRIARAWLDYLTDTSIVATAIAAGFPAHLTPMVSVSSLRAWLTTPAYGDNNPRFTHILDTARTRYADAYPDLAGCADCGAQESEDCHPFCSTQQPDDAPIIGELVRADDLPDSWRFANVVQLESLARHRARMNTLHVLEITSGKTNAPTATDFVDTMRRL
ncbi:hypothetical protein GCM10010404_81020 [Nonomuraea africana]|uniref:Uncharacterized protein n=1 Tax=Nonomuraea africana TaxID=46171 RepID=A0ABR9KXM8_9ACTN|nr:hypothetical protein [Nonomuraea africana]MBE1566520.1 hypothetical protein [Nonomuraea africana]